MAEHSRSIAEQRYDIRHVTAHVLKILEAENSRASEISDLRREFDVEPV